jgi:photosystem II stability/assembly factor-like uncharacterized protein
MRAVLVVVLVLAACTSVPNAATPPTQRPTTSPIALPSFAQIVAPSGTVVWALVAGTHLFRSLDSGETWAERSLPSGLDNVDISFADERNGLALSVGSPATQCQAQSAAIWKTADGAASWQNQGATGIPDGMCKSGLASADTVHAFFAAWSPNAAPLLYRTSDGGQTWKASTALPNPPGFTSKGAGAALRPGRPHALGGIVLVDAVGAAETRYVFRSTDGGATFTYASTVPTIEGALALVTATRWMQMGAPGSSMETTDAGGTWHAYKTDYSQAAPIAGTFSFGHYDIGYGTVRGSIQRTADGGAHWTTIKTPGTG